MEQERLTDDDIILWNNFHHAEEKFLWTRHEFLKGVKNRTLVIRKALNNPRDRGTALRLLLCCLNAEDRLPFFNDLVSQASVDHSDLELCWEVILSLPKDFLLENIENSAESVLRKATQEAYVEYRCLLGLYIQIDPYLTERLAQKALQSEDEDVREAGEDFIRLLENPDEQPTLTG